MPSAVDPLVLNNAAAVAQNFVLYTPAAGDNGVATWKLKVGTISGVFPTVTIVARPTGNAARRSQIKLRIPSSYVDASSGLTQVGPAFEFDGYTTVPDAFPESQKADAIAYVKNLLAHALAQAVMKDGLPAT